MKILAIRLFFFTSILCCSISCDRIFPKKENQSSNDIKNKNSNSFNEKGLIEKTLPRDFAFLFLTTTNTSIDLIDSMAKGGGHFQFIANESKKYIK